MDQTLTKFNLHGVLAEQFGASWEFAVNSVSQGLNAINQFTQKKFFQFLHDNDEKGVKYRVLINGNDFVSEKPCSDAAAENVLSSELVMNMKNLKTVDIVPVIEGSAAAFLFGDDDSGWFNVISGALLIIAGIALLFVPGAQIFGVALIIGGVGLLAAGVIAMLSKPPTFEDFRQVEKGKLSYLFDGPQQTTREGGPVPVVYGRLMVGSQVIAAAYVIRQIDVENDDSLPIFTPSSGGDVRAVNGRLTI